jgi:hypothetical protein
MATPASSCNSSRPSAKLTIAPTSPTMRVTAGDNDVSCRPSAASRAQNPAAHGAQW